MNVPTNDSNFLPPTYRKRTNEHKKVIPEEEQRR
jgi:hypothetical protein